MYRIAPLLDFNAKRVLCMSLVQPCIDFCILSWYLDLASELRGSLDVLQRKMVRYVYGWDPRRHVGTATLRELGWLTVPDRVRFFALLHVFRIRKGTAPLYLQRGFTKVSEVHSHWTRSNAHNYHISREDMPGSFAYFGKVQWNALPDSLKALERLDLFKAKLKQYLMRDY